MAKSTAKTNDLVDPKIKKHFLEMRDEWAKLDDVAGRYAGKRRKYEGEIKQAGFSMQQIKDSIQLSTPEGEAAFKANIANRLLAAAYSDADVGDQLSLFLDHNRTPAVDRAYKEGQTKAMKNEAMVCDKYSPDTEQYRAFVEGYHDEQGRQVKGGIKKLDAKKPAGKSAGKSAAKPAGKRGRPKKSVEVAATAPERTLIKKADKDAKAAARAPKPDAAPPRRPAAAPVTRAGLAAQKAAAKDEAESYFQKSEPAGNA